MRLTTSMRDAFVRAALDDVPEVDYNEQAAQLVRKIDIERLPPDVRKLAKNPALASFLAHSYRTVAGFHIMVHDADVVNNLPDDILARLTQMKAASSAQSETRRDLRTKLKGAAYSVGTRKALAELLPEFEKYLPTDPQQASRTVPALANIVADFTQAGWPKGGK